MKIINIFRSLVLFICLFRSTRGTNFTCKNSDQIISDYFCDDQSDCSDGSDEMSTTQQCPECDSHEISCNNTENPFTGLCVIHRDFICNGSVTCRDVTPCDVGCTSHYRCAKTSECVPRFTVCDGDSCSGCPEDTEWTSGHGFKCVRNGRLCLLPQQLLVDDVIDCDSGEDLCYVTNGTKRTLNSNLCFECLDRSALIPRSRICDGAVDCPDLSDECLCEGQIPSICSDIHMPYSGNKSDDVIKCKAGQVTCGDGWCIERNSVCDGIRDCNDARDEAFGFCRGTLRCADGLHAQANQTCRCDKECQTIFGVLCNGIAECPAPGFGDTKWAEPPGFPEDECSGACFHPDILKFLCTSPMPEITFDSEPFEPIQCQYELHMEGPDPDMPSILGHRFVFDEHICDGIIDCPLTMEDELEERCPHRFRCKAGNLASIPKSKVCDGEPDCDDYSDEINDTCSDRFYCSVLGNTKISIERKYVCDFNINCDDGSDESNCHDDERFYCEGGEPLFVESRKKFDGRGDCLDWSDECPTMSKPPDHNIFSSKYELIGNPVLRAFVWIMGIVAIFGNTFVLVNEFKTLCRICAKADVSATLQANHMLVLNLASADLLMGVYLIMLGSAGAAYSGVYCSSHLAWLSSSMCTAMGVLVVVSSQTSVITMVLLTSFRLYAVFNPFDSSTKPNPKLVISLIITAWTCALVIALLPLSSSFQSVFVEKAVLPQNPFFKNIVVDIESAKVFAKKLLLFDPKISNNTLPSPTFSAESWLELQNVVSRDTNHPEYMMTSQWLGYYSANSVCIPRLFVTTDVSSWSFSFFVTVFNFISFIFVSIAYVIIYVKSKSSSSFQNMRSIKSQKLSKALQRKIIRLIATDFCCWVPISVMAFINLAGVRIPPLGYVVAAVILLPVNSALNPVLYSSVMDKYVEKAWKRTSVFSSTFRTQDTSVPGSTRSKFSSTRV